MWLVIPYIEMVKKKKTEKKSFQRGSESSALDVKFRTTVSHPSGDQETS